MLPARCRNRNPGDYSWPAEPSSPQSQECDEGRARHQGRERQADVQDPGSASRRSQRTGRGSRGLRHTCAGRSRSGSRVRAVPWTVTIGSSNQGAGCGRQRDDRNRADRTTTAMCRVARVIAAPTSPPTAQQSRCADGKTSLRREPRSILSHVGSPLEGSVSLRNPSHAEPRHSALVRPKLLPRLKEVRHCASCWWKTTHRWPPSSQGRCVRRIAPSTSQATVKMPPISEKPSVTTLPSLDLGLPKMAGVSVVQAWRSAGRASRCRSLPPEMNGLRRS